MNLQHIDFLPNKLTLMSGEAQNVFHGNSSLLFHLEIFVEHHTLLTSRNTEQNCIHGSWVRLGLPCPFPRLCWWPSCPAPKCTVPPHPFLLHATQGRRLLFSEWLGGHLPAEETPSPNQSLSPEYPSRVKSLAFPAQDYHYFLWFTQQVVTPPSTSTMLCSPLLGTYTQIRMWYNLYFLFTFFNSASLTGLSRRLAAHANACWIDKAQSKSQHLVNSRAQSMSPDWWPWWSRTFQGSRNLH